MEDAVGAVGFPSLDIMQPSLLLGPRKEIASARARWAQFFAP